MPKKPVIAYAAAVGIAAVVTAASLYGVVGKLAGRSVFNSAPYHSVIIDKGVDTQTIHSILAEFTAKDLEGLTEVTFTCGKIFIKGDEYSGFYSHNFSDKTGRIIIYDGCYNSKWELRSTFEHELQHHQCYREERKDCHGHFEVKK